MDWFIAHLVGDYLLQNDWMANNKKGTLLPTREDNSRCLPNKWCKWCVGSVACGVHVLLYTLSVWAFTRWPWWALAIVASTHFIQDRTNIIAWSMRVKGQAKFMQPPCGPWSIIVVDNVWHLVTLYLISLRV